MQELKTGWSGLVSTGWFLLVIGNCWDLTPQTSARPIGHLRRICWNRSQHISQRATCKRRIKGEAGHQHQFRLPRSGKLELFLTRIKHGALGGEELPPRAIRGLHAQMLARRELLQKPEVAVAMRGDDTASRRAR
jgi:hypothetical protein